jgi:hypothetical protein
MLDCKEASRLVSQSLDRRLDWRERCGLALHLAMCAACRRFARQLRWLRQAWQHFARRVEADESLKMPQEATQRIREVLDARARSE